MSGYVHGCKRLKTDEYQFYFNVKIYIYYTKNIWLKQNLMFIESNLKYWILNYKPACIFFHTWPPDIPTTPKFKQIWPWQHNKYSNNHKSQLPAKQIQALPQIYYSHLWYDFDVWILLIIPLLTMIYWVLTLVISPEGQELFSSTLAGQL